jgi:hypothetical protein
LVDLSDNQPRDFVRASAVSMAFWFADNWWRLRWEPIADHVTADWRLRHELTSASGGMAWPPLMIYGVGLRVVIAPISTIPEIGNGPIEYRPIPVTILPGGDYEEAIKNFFQTVLAKCEHASDASSLKALVQQLANEWCDPQLSAWRQLEAQLGFDPDKAPNGLIEKLVSLDAQVGEGAVEEAAVARPGASAPEVLERVIQASRASKIEVDLTLAKAVAQPTLDKDLTKSIWMVAEDAAARLRVAAVGRTDGPILNKALTDILQQKWSRIKAAPSTARDLPYGARMHSGERVQKLALQSTSTPGRRFELARMIGDAVWSGDALFGISSRAKTDRQKFQRAFAQSLLCPFEDLRQHIDLSGPTDGQIEAAARRYHVHPMVVRTLLVNKGFLPRSTLAEMLEAA